MIKSHCHPAYPLRPVELEDARGDETGKCRGQDIPRVENGNASGDFGPGVEILDDQNAPRVVGCFDDAEKEASE